MTSGGSAWDGTRAARYRTSGVAGRLKVSVPRVCQVRTALGRELRAFFGSEVDPGHRSLRHLACPAAVHKLKCRGREDCCPSAFGRVVRVQRQKDVQSFCRVPPSSPNRERRYKRRSAVELVNSRPAVSFGFEEHSKWLEMPPN